MAVRAGFEPSMAAVRVNERPVGRVPFLFAKAMSAVRGAAEGLANPGS